MAAARPTVNVQFWTGVGLVIAAVFCLVGYFFAKADAQNYQKNGIAASALILDKYTQAEHNVRDNNDTTTYVLKLSLQAGPQQIDDARYVSEDTYNAFQKGKTLPVLYLPKDPKSFKVAAKTEDDQVFCLAFFSGLLAVVGVGTSAFGLRRGSNTAANAPLKVPAKR